MADDGRFPGALRVLLALACFVAVVAGMRAASSLVVPFLLAVFIAIICAGPLFWLQRKGVPKWAALLLILVVIVGVTLLLGIFVGKSVTRFTQSLPEYQSSLTERTAGIMTWIENRGIDIPDDALSKHLNLGTAMQLASSMLSSLSGMMANAFLILLAVTFILLEASDFPDKLRAALSNAESSLAGFQEFAGSVNRYMAIKTWISAGTGLCAYLLCKFLGIDYAFLWGVTAFLFNYIPNIGSVIAMVPPMLLALIQYGPWPALMTGVGYVVINVVFGSVIEPRLMGGRLGISTLVVFISLVFWGWVLGPVGMVLSLPLTMVLKIALESSKDTRWIAVLLGSRSG